jgi:hypothetical protein
MIKTTKITNGIHAVNLTLGNKSSHKKYRVRRIRGIAYVPTQENAWRVNRMLREWRLLRDTAL